MSEYRIMFNKENTAVEKSMTEKGTETTASSSTSLGGEAFSELPFDEKRLYLDKVLPREKMDLISGDPDNKKLTRSMQPQELYWLFKELVQIYHLIQSSANSSFIK